MPRHRSMAFGRVEGTITFIPTGAISKKVIDPTHIDICDDSQFITGDQPLEIVHKGYEVVGTVSGEEPHYPIYSFSGYPMDGQGTTDSHLSVPNIPDSTAAITTMMAKTNPSRPEVSVPNFIFELKDIPEMLHLKGKKHAESRPGNSAVAYNFGWDLLIKDLIALTDFTSQVDKRVKELKALHAKGGLRRKRTLFDESVSESNYHVFQSFTAWVDGTLTKKTRAVVWATCRWNPASPDIPSATDLVDLARRVVHGWDFSSSGLASVIWEATPWSWFSDYFLNVGDYLNATRNAVGATAGSGCVMYHVTTTETGKIQSTSPGFGAIGPKYVYETKSRVLATAGLTASLPFLSAKQMANLSSIAFNLGR